ncbi:bola-like protein [Ramicandelaber brevisporus]|nr:bola-like protein [Ramicandelaber brevisporus]
MTDQSAVTPELIKEIVFRDLKITAADGTEYTTEFVEVEDQSGGCGQAFKVCIVSPGFARITLLQRHRLVNEVLKDIIPRIHAFSQKTFTPEQWEVFKVAREEAIRMAALQQ